MPSILLTIFAFSAAFAAQDASPRASVAVIGRMQRVLKDVPDFDYLRMLKADDELHQEVVGILLSQLELQDTEAKASLEFKWSFDPEPERLARGLRKAQELSVLMVAQKVNAKAALIEKELGRMDEREALKAYHSLAPFLGFHPAVAKRITDAAEAALEAARNDIPR